MTFLSCEKLLIPRAFVLCRTGKDGYLQIDGGAAVRGESRGRSIMVNTKGSVYLGERPDSARPLQLHPLRAGSHVFRSQFRLLAFVFGNVCF